MLRILCGLFGSDSWVDFFIFGGCGAKWGGGEDALDRFAG